MVNGIRNTGAAVRVLKEVLNVLRKVYNDFYG